MTAHRAAAVVAITLAGMLVVGCSSKKSDQAKKAQQQRAAAARTAAQNRAPQGPAARARAARAASSAGAAVPAAGTAAVPFFSPTSPWNTPVDSVSVDPRSPTLIRLAQIRFGGTQSGFNQQFSSNQQISQTRTLTNAGLYINTRRWTVPLADAALGTPTQIVCRQIPRNCGDGTGLNSLRIPSTDSPHPEFDGWFTVIDRAQGLGYDFWRARRAPNANVISYQFLRKWDLNGPGFLRPSAVSARGSGLPLFAGLILPDEVRAGQINHALAISVPGPAQRNYVRPASTTDGVGATNSIPEGARLRLKSSVSLRKLPGDANPRAAEAILRALKRYGAIVVDRSKVPTLYAQFNFDWSKRDVGAGTAATTPSQVAGSSTDQLGQATGRETGQATGAPAPTNQPGAVAPGAVTTQPSIVQAPALRGRRGRTLRRRRRSFALLRGDEIQNLKVSDFQVVALPSIRQEPPASPLQVTQLVP